jgi:FAD:protein FMN transferase
MRRRTFLQTGFGLASVATGEWRDSHASSSAEDKNAPVWLQRNFNALGTSMQLRVAHRDAEAAELAIAAARADIALVEDQMSLFRADSALRTLNQQGQLRHPHPDLRYVLRAAQDIARRSQGAFDVTVQALWNVYDQARNEGRLPSRAEVAEAQARTGWRDLQLSDDAVRLARPGMGVTLNGIAPGFAADKVRATLLRHGVQHALIGTGEWASIGQAEGGRDWTLGIASPRGAHDVLARLSMQGRCVATSADDECTFSADHRYHHIVDPRTGYSPPALASVTVIAPTCMVADAVTKVLFMADFQSAIALAQRWQVDALVVNKQGLWQTTPGFPLLAA